MWEGKGKEGKAKGNHLRDSIQGKEKEGEKKPNPSSKAIIKLSSLKTNSKYLYSQCKVKHEAEINCINCQTQSTDLLYLDILNGKQMGKQAQKFYLVFQEDK